MLAGFLRFFSRGAPDVYDNAFVKDVRSRPPRIGNRRMDLLIVAAWILILIKSIIVVWVTNRWEVPVGPAWVIVPTLMMAVAGTIVYLQRR